MLRRFLFTAGAIVVAAAPALAADRVQPVRVAPAPVVISPGHSWDASIYWGVSKLNEYNRPDDETEAWGGNEYGGLVRFRSPVNPGLNFQLDVFGEHWQGNDFADNHMNVYDAAAHFDWMKGMGGFVGVMAAAGHNDDFPNGGANFGTFAFEGQQSWAGMMLYGQAGYAGQFSATGDDAHGAYIHLAALYAVSPSVDFTGDVGYGVLTQDQRGMSLLRWGLKLDMNLASTPFSLFLNYQGRHDSWDNGNSEMAHTLLAGIKLNFGGADSMRVNYSPFTGVNYVRDGF